MKEPSKSIPLLIRLWTNDGGEDGHPTEWHGRVQPIGEGRAATFDDWTTLQRILETLLHGDEGSDIPLEGEED